MIGDALSKTRHVRAEADAIEEATVRTERESSADSIGEQRKRRAFDKRDLLVNLPQHELSRHGCEPLSKVTEPR